MEKIVFELIVQIVKKMWGICKVLILMLPIYDLLYFSMYCLLFFDGGQIHQQK